MPTKIALAIQSRAPSTHARQPRPGAPTPPGVKTQGPRHMEFVRRSLQGEEGGFSVCSGGRDCDSDAGAKPVGRASGRRRGRRRRRAARGRRARLQPRLGRAQAPGPGPPQGHRRDRRRGARGGAQGRARPLRPRRRPQRPGVHLLFVEPGPDRRQGVLTGLVACLSWPRANISRRRDMLDTASTRVSSHCRFASLPRPARGSPRRAVEAMLTASNEALAS